MGEAIGHVTWHTSEEGGGPDVGLQLSLGRGDILWAGEITTEAWMDAGGEEMKLGKEYGHWLILYKKGKPRQVLGRFTNIEARDALIDTLVAAFHKGGK